ncbi:MAG TPA: hypothetical protein VG078_10655 [Acidimicrobiales bacterium]|nr:hypothetical protein [Acidimicrobiales bacterium]
MTVTDTLLANNERHASGFSKGDLPLPQGRSWPSWRAGTPVSTPPVPWVWRRATPT